MFSSIDNVTIFWLGEAINKVRKQPPTREVLYKKMSLKILKISLQKTTLLKKKRLQHKCCLVKFANALRTPILKKICGWQLLKVYSTSLLLFLQSTLETP